MKIFAHVLIGCLALAGACKKKVIVDPQSSQSEDLTSNGPAIGSGNWQGLEDKVDPALGTLKTLD